MKLSEKQIEDVFEVYYKELLSPNFTLIHRQFIFKNKRRADLIFVDENNRKIIVELKRTSVTREDIGQLFEYRGILDNENPRIILAAPIIPSIMKKSFEHFGIEYLEFNIKEIEKLYFSLSDKKVERVDLKIDEILSEPLSSKKVRDGNVAFKITYNDNNWKNVCSPNIAEYNFENRTWCGIQSKHVDNCQSEYFKTLSDEIYPCMDSVALRDLSFYAGHFHGEKHNNEPKRALNIKIGKIALFTSREPGTPENERFIFAIAQLDNITDTEGYEMFHCNKNTAVIFKSNYRPKFWDFYRNKNTTKEKWNTGLIRYFDDSQITNMLNSLLTNKRLTNKQRINIKNLLHIF